MHTGPAIERNGDWFGASVNLAARVSGQAGGGEVLLTEATRQASSSLHGIEFRNHGAKRFKNVSRPIRVYRAAYEGKESDGLPIDPVCRMAVDPGHGAGTLTHEGINYHFCSLECVRAFVASPEDFVGSE
jgi:YHS domain-containing protein